jgi:GAF domain-containing protein
LPERNPEAYFHLTPDEVGWVAKVARERKGIVVPDLLAEPPEKFKYYEHVQRLETHSYCAVPMLAGDRLIGVFEIGHRETGRYDGSDLAVLEHLAASVSMAVHTVRLHETLQGDLKRVTADRDRRRVLMDAVAQVDSALNAEVSDEEVFRRLLNQVLGLLRQHAAMVWGHVRKTDETGQGAYLVHDGSDGPYRDAISPYRLVGSHVSGHILTSGETDIWRERPASDPQLAAMIKEARREGSESTAEFLERIEWLIGWPLKARDGVVGTLCVYGPEPYSIPDEVLYTAGLLVAHGAVAIGLAQMRGTYDMRGQVRDVVLHAAQGLSQDIDVKRLLQHVCQAARAMLGADVAVYGCRRVETDGHGYELVAWDVPAGAAAPRGGTVDLPHEPLGREVWLIRDHAELLYRAFGEGVRSALLAPLRYRYGGGKVPQGVLIAESVKPSKFEEREVEALKVLASAAGSHLERAVAVTTEWDWLVHKLRHPMALAQHLIELCTEPTEESAPGLALAPSREVVRGAQAAIDLFNATDTGVSFLALREREDYATEFRLVDLPDLVQHVCRLAEAPLETRKVPCTVEPSAAGVRVKGHAGALRSILYEVISNALQNDPAGNYDPKSIPPIEVTVSRVADRARVAVKDSGPPLNKEQADRVFARHVALRAGGGGLGLFIVQAVVAAHEGRTWVEPLDSSPKSFVVEVPVAPGPDTNRDATLGQPDSAVGP